MSQHIQHRPYQYLVRVEDETGSRTHRTSAQLVVNQVLDTGDDPEWQGPTVTVVEIVKQPRLGNAGEVVVRRRSSA